MTSGDISPLADKVVSHRRRNWLDGLPTELFIGAPEVSADLSLPFVLGKSATPEHDN